MHVVSRVMRRILLFMLVVSAIVVILTPTTARAETGNNYPWASDSHFPACSSDNWGYCKRYCTSWVAWALHDRNGFELPWAIGDARSWGQWAREHNYAVDMNPQRGSVAWWTANHVAWVRSVSGNAVVIEEYNNPAGSGSYSIRTISKDAVSGYIHFRDLGQNLAFIKTRDTGSGSIEVHQAYQPYTSFVSATSGFSPYDQNNGWFSMVGDKLVFIKTRNTGSGRVELHWRTAASGYRSGLSVATWFSVADQNNGWFSLMGTDLVFIKTKNTGSGRIEVHRVGAANYTAPPSSRITALSVADADNGWFQLYGPNQDLVFIKTKHTGSGRVEVHIVDGPCGFCRINQSSISAFSWVDQDNGWFSIRDVNADGRGDLVFIKTHNVGSGHVELFAADGATAFSQITLAVATAFHPVDASNGWFMMAE